MAASLRVVLAALAMNLFALTLHDPSASSRPVRAELTAETTAPRIGRA